MVLYSQMEDRLLVLWTTGEKTVAMNMVCMYTLNSKIKGWWEKVTLLIWGAAGDLLINDPEVKDKVAEIRDAGVEVIACKRCAENMDIVEKLEEQPPVVKVRTTELKQAEDDVQPTTVSDSPAQNFSKEFMDGVKDIVGQAMRGYLEMPEVKLSE